MLIHQQIIVLEMSIPLEIEAAIGRLNLELEQILVG